MKRRGTDLESWLRPVLLPALLGLPILLLTGCDRSKRGATAAARPVAELAVRRGAEAPPLVLAGGRPGTVGILCGDQFHRLEAGNEAFSVDRSAALDYRAVAFGDGAESDRFLVRTGGGLALAERGMALPLAGWPEGVEPGAATFAASGDVVAAAPAGGADRAVRVWRLPDWSPVTLGVTAGRTARHLSWDDSGRYLLVVDDANRVAIYKLPDTKPVYDQVLDPASEGVITAADLSPDGDWFVLAAEKIRVRSWRLPFLSAPLAAWGRVNAVFFAGGVEALVTYDETGAAIRWLLNNGNVQAGGSAQLGTAAAWGFDSGGRVLALLDSAGAAGGWRTEDLTGLEAIAAPLCPAVGE